MHGTFASLFAGLCFIYADGTPNTTWFHCNFYKLHTFESQKFLLAFSMGYFIYDLLCILYNGKRNDPNYSEMSLHRLLSIA